jgi:hypothetical protein
MSFSRHTKAMARGQTLDEAYAEPSNFLEIDVTDAQTHGFGNVTKKNNKERYKDICGRKEESKRERERERERERMRGNVKYRSENYL